MFFFNFLFFFQENSGLVVPWILGFITFMALEAVAMVYSNVLRDHVNRQFDALCKAEVAFFISRAFLNSLAMWGVMRFYNLLRIGITWKGPEIIEL
uniref:CSON002828 protein n=1 Tax=Culicoides sonorensis TaxID=179676 RepID=A0A336LX46_CULSO